MTPADFARYNHVMAPLRHILLVFGTVVVATMVAVPAFGQAHAREERADLILSTTTTSTAVAVGVVMLTVVAVKKNPTALRSYLDSNELAVRAALAVGAGDELDDLAALFGYQDALHLERFAALLRRERRALTILAYQRRDVAAFIRHVEAAIQLDPALRSS